MGSRRIRSPRATHFRRRNDCPQARSIAWAISLRPWRDACAWSSRRNDFSLSSEQYTVARRATLYLRVSNVVALESTPSKSSVAMVRKHLTHSEQLSAERLYAQTLSVSSATSHRAMCSVFSTRPYELPSWTMRASRVEKRRSVSGWEPHGTTWSARCVDGIKIES